jgi:hypothetical protein
MIVVYETPASRLKEIVKGDRVDAAFAWTIRRDKVEGDQARSEEDDRHEPVRRS